MPRAGGPGHDVRVEWAQATAIISAFAVITSLQAFWISHALDRVYARLDGVNGRLNRIDTRLDQMESRVLRDHAERIARLEASR